MRACGMRLAGRVFVFSVVLTLPFLAAPQASAEDEPTAPQMTCPNIPYWPVTKRARFPKLLTDLFPPLKIAQEIGRDPLENAPKRQVSVTVVDEAGKPVRGALAGFLRLEGKEERKDARFLAETRPGTPVAVPHGDYVVNAAAAAKDGGIRWGSQRLTVGPKGTARVTVKITQTIAPVRPHPLAAETFQGAELAVDFDGFWQPAATVDVVWMGPKSTHTNIDDDDGLPSMPPNVQDKPFKVAIPGRAGAYEIRYTLCAPRLVLARWPVRVKRAEVSIEAPAQAPVASVLNVTLRGMLGPAQTLHLRDAEGDSKRNERISQRGEQQVTIRLPFEPGRYELAVTTQGDRTPLARRPLVIEPAPIAIAYPEHVALGTPATLDWPLSGSIDTSVALWSAPAQGKPARQIWDRLRPGTGRLVAAPGDYELRLFQHRGTRDPRVIARKPVRVEGRAFESVPGQVAAEQALTVKLALAGQFFDRVMFVPRGKDRALSLFDETHPRGNEVAIKAPAKPGAYDLIYAMGEVGQRMIVERVPVEVR